MIEAGKYLQLAAHQGHTRMAVACLTIICFLLVLIHSANCSWLKVKIPNHVIPGLY